MTPARRRSQRSQSHNPDDRLRWLTITVSLIAGIILVRIFYLQIIQHGTYEALAESQHALQSEILPERGNIFATTISDPNTLIPLASNRTYWLLYAVPEDIVDAEETADKITSILSDYDLDREDLIYNLSKTDDLYEKIAEKVTDTQKKEIDNLNLPGIYFTTERIRYYPEKNVGAHMLGFVGYDGDELVGRYGLEGAMQEELAGTKGYVKADRDTAGRWIVVGSREFEQARDGTNLVLTIDYTIQYTACTKLNEAVQRHGADSGSVVIMNPKTGAILAMCGSPDFDPNRYNEVDDIGVYLNESVQGAYEPGSIFKAITMAMALNEGAVTPQTTYVDDGQVQVGSYTIENSDHEAHGTQTMTQVLEKSLNTGAIFAMRTVGPDTFRDYVHLFGFGEKTGIEIQGESEGNVSNLELPGEIYAVTSAFGQGLTVTPLQIVTAFAAIANGGTLMEPYLIERTLNPDSSVKEETIPQEVRRVITQQTATTLGAMLVNVVENGHGTKAAVPGYYIAGKTGTAQVKSDEGTGYDARKTIGSFAGFGPVSDPAFVMIVRIDNPKDVQFAESTAAPLFGDIAKFLLHYLQIPPDRVE